MGSNQCNHFILNRLATKVLIKHGLFDPLFLIGGRWQKTAKESLFEN